TPITRCPCVASNSVRTCSGPPKSSSARASAASSDMPAALCSAAASSRCSRNSWRMCWRSDLGPAMLRQTWSRDCSSLSIGFPQDEVEGPAQVAPRLHLLLQRRLALFGDVVVPPLAPRLLLFPLADDQPVRLQLVQARVQRALAPRERPFGVAVHRRG